MRSNRVMMSVGTAAFGILAVVGIQFITACKPRTFNSDVKARTPGSVQNLEEVGDSLDQLEFGEEEDLIVKSTGNRVVTKTGNDTLAVGDPRTNIVSQIKEMSQRYPDKASIGPRDTFQAPRKIDPDTEQVYSETITEYRQAGTALVVRRGPNGEIMNGLDGKPIRDSVSVSNRQRRLKNVAGIKDDLDPDFFAEVAQEQDTTPAALSPAFDSKVVDLSTQEWKWNRKVYPDDDAAKSNGGIVPLEKGGVIEKKKRIAIHTDELDWYHSSKGQAAFAQELDASPLYVKQIGDPAQEAARAAAVDKFIAKFLLPQKQAALLLQEELPTLIAKARDRGEKVVGISLPKYLFDRPKTTKFLSDLKNPFSERMILQNTALAGFLSLRGSEDLSIKVSLEEAEELARSPDILKNKYFRPVQASIKKAANSASNQIRKHARMETRSMAGWGYDSYDFMEEQRYLRRGFRILIGKKDPASKNSQKEIEVTCDSQVRYFVKNAANEKVEVVGPIPKSTVVVEFKFPREVIDKGFIDSLGADERVMFNELFAQVDKYQSFDLSYNSGKKGKFFASLGDIFEKLDNNTYKLKPGHEEFLKEAAKASGVKEGMTLKGGDLGRFMLEYGDPAWIIKNLAHSI